MRHRAARQSRERSTYLIPGLGPADRLYHAPTEGPLITLRIEGNKATTTSFNGIKKSIRSKNTIIAIYIHSAGLQKINKQ